jgi:Flp pilus assembly protein TadD
MARPSRTNRFTTGSTIERSMLSGGSDGDGTIAERCNMLIDILQRTPEAKDERLLLVSLLDAAGAHDEALLVMAQGIDYHDRDAEIYVRLGEMLMARGRTEDAFNAFEIALSLAPEAGVLQRALASLVRLTEQTTGARARDLHTAAAPAGARFARAATNN